MQGGGLGEAAQAVGDTEEEDSDDGDGDDDDDDGDDGGDHGDDCGDNGGGSEEGQAGRGVEPPDEHAGSLSAAIATVCEAYAINVPQASGRGVKRAFGSFVRTVDS